MSGFEPGSYFSNRDYSVTLFNLGKVSFNNIILQNPSTNIINAIVPLNCFSPVRALIAMLWYGIWVKYARDSNPWPLEGRRRRPRCAMGTCTYILIKFKKIGDLNLPHFYLIGHQKYCKTFLTRLCLLARLFQNVPTRQKVCKMKIGARNNVIKWRLHQLLLEGYLRHFRGEHWRNLVVKNMKTLPWLMCLLILFSVTRKKLPNIYKSCLKLI